MIIDGPKRKTLQELHQAAREALFDLQTHESLRDRLYLKLQRAQEELSEALDVFLARLGP